MLNRLLRWSSKIKSHFPRSVTEAHSKDTGMAAALICLLIGYFGKSDPWIGAGILVLILTMSITAVFRWPAVFWLGLSSLLGTLVSTVLLTLVFFLLVTPVGCIRRMFGADPLNLKGWKKSEASVFETRNHHYCGCEIEKPY